ncbi:hypothetical protein Pfo_017159 [Paulownia fortunei]|nr:hypothetical protein Pfo_017159 [Paulownia fortunei]
MPNSAHFSVSVISMEPFSPGTNLGLRVGLESFNCCNRKPPLARRVHIPSGLSLLGCPKLLLELVNSLQFCYV